MTLPPFLLDQWLDGHSGPGIEFNLASSTGPAMTIAGLLGGGAGAGFEGTFPGSLLSTQISYAPAQGIPELREAIAAMYGADPDSVLVLNGAAEALHITFAVAATRGGNVIVPRPAFPPTREIPLSLGLELREYELRRENGFRIDLEVIARLADTGTRVIVVNSPHNPSGTVADAATMSAVCDLARDVGARAIFDEVYWPLSYDAEPVSASGLEGATVVGSLSKSFRGSGLRVGWIVEPDPSQRAELLNTRMYFSVATGTLDQAVATVVVRRRAQVLDQARRTAIANIAALDGLIAWHSRDLAWCRPSAGTTSFPWLTSGANSRPLCEALAASGVLVVPGDCFGSPNHFRVGFAYEQRFEKALERMDRVLSSMFASV
jgi:aspartate/methionine/tyrosine aminotransferase